MNASAAAAAMTNFLAAGPETGVITMGSDRFLDRPDGRIAFTDAGTGPLVVMVPGLGDLKEEYRFLAPKLLAAGYRTVTMDIRGHGNSSTGWPDYSSSALGSDVVALLRHLHAGPAAVIGTSMGAGAVAWAAAEAPDAIRDLVVIGPFMRELPAALWWTDKLQKILIKAAFAGPWATSAWAAYYATLYPTAKPADFEAYKAKLTANLAEPGRMAATKAMMNASKADVGSRLADVRARALVVMGSKDPDFPDAAKEAATVAGLLHGTFAMIDGAGHYPHAEMPAATAPIVLDFLAAGASA
jgi:pimeloyl-ACP methyl ester carboxylesterase